MPRRFAAPGSVAAGWRMWFTIGAAIAGGHESRGAGFSASRARRGSHMNEAGMRFAGFWTGASLGLGSFIAAAVAQEPGLGRPVEWQIGLQKAATPVMENIRWFHNLLLLPIITLITLFVLGLLVVVMVKFNAKANPVPSRTTHNTFIEILRTVLPILILDIIAIYSIRLLHFEHDIPKCNMSIKAIG